MRSEKFIKYNHLQLRPSARRNLNAREDLGDCRSTPSITGEVVCVSEFTNWVPRCVSDSTHDASSPVGDESTVIRSEKDGVDERLPSAVARWFKSVVPISLVMWSDES